MFANILGKTKKETSGDEEHQKLVAKVSKMNLIDMRTYVNNKLNGFEICEDGLCEVMHRLNSKDAKGIKYFIESDAMDSKKKKAFEVVIMAASSKKVTVTVTELIQEFIENYQDIITKYDKDNKDIYADKLKTALNNALVTLGTMAEVNKKMKVIGS